MVELILRSLGVSCHIKRDHIATIGHQPIHPNYTTCIKPVKDGILVLTLKAVIATSHEYGTSLL